MKIGNYYNKHYKIFNFIYSLLFVIGYDNYLFTDGNIGNRSIFNFILLFLVYNLFETTKKTKNKSIKVPFIFGLLLSLSLIVGKSIFINNNLSILYTFKGIILTILSIISFTKVFENIIFKLFDKINLIKDNKKQWKFYKNKHIFLIIFIIMLVCWGICYLSYYPGIFSYDSIVQLYEIYDEFHMSTHHPVIHTFFFRMCLFIYNRTGIEAILIYSVIQMIVFALSLTSLIKLLINKKVNNWIILFAILFLTVNPIVGVFSFIMTKDVLFAAFLVLFIIETIKFVDEPKRYLDNKVNLVIYMFYILMTILFRNNALYVILLFIPFLIFIFKKYYKQILIIFMIPIIIVICFNNIIVPRLGIIKVSSSEMLSVPIQQISLMVIDHKNILSDEEKNEINNYIDLNKMCFKYNYRFADPVKSLFNNDYYDINKAKFYKLWAKYLIDHPDSYVNAFLSLNLPYFYIDSKTIDNYSNREYIETGIYETKFYSLKRDSKIPWLYNILEEIVHYKIFENIPFISLMLSITLPVWFILFTLFILLYRNQYKHVIILIPIILLYLTYILGPVNNFRYVFPIFVLYPLLLAFIYDKFYLIISKKK